MSGAFIPSSPLVRNMSVISRDDNITHMQRNNSTVSAQSFIVSPITPNRPMDWPMWQSDPGFDTPVIDAAAFEAAKYDASKYDETKYDAEKYDEGKYDPAKYDGSGFEDAGFEFDHGQQPQPSPGMRVQSFRRPPPPDMSPIDEGQELDGEESMIYELPGDTHMPPMAF